MISAVFHNEAPLFLLDSIHYHNTRIRNNINTETPVTGVYRILTLAIYSASFGISIPGSLIDTAYCFP